MANIFTAVEKLDKTSLINLISNVEIVTLTNVFGQYGNKAKKKL